MNKGNKGKYRKVTRRTKDYTPSANINDDNWLVWVDRKLSSERSARALAMNSSQADILDFLPSIMQDACGEIEFCHRYLTNELHKLSNPKAYGIVTGGGDIDDKAEKVLPYYYAWQKLTPAKKRHIVFDVVFTALGLRGLATKHGFLKPSTAARFIMESLNDYCIERGWGDQWEEFKIEPPSFIYVAGPEGGPYKIGRSIEPHNRISALQMGNPQDIHLYHTVEVFAKSAQKIETKIHRYYKEKKLRGEWFDVPLREIVATVDSLAENA